jgi:hypothetical protein
VTTDGGTSSTTPRTEKVRGPFRNFNVGALIGYLVFIGGIVLYIYLYYSFLHDIVDAPDGKPPNLINGDVQLASAIGGALGAAFAVALGIQRADTTVNEKRLQLGKTLTPRAEWVSTVTVLVYFAVGVAVVVVSRTNGAETPQEIQATATLFAGYLASIFTAVLSGPGQTAQEPPETG